MRYWREPKAQHRGTEYREGFLDLLDYRALAERADYFVIGAVVSISCRKAVWFWSVICPSDKHYVESYQCKVAALDPLTLEHFKAAF